MTIEFDELKTSRRGTGSASRSTELTLSYRSRGSDDLTDLVTALASLAPTTVVDPFRGQTLYRHDVDFEPEVILGEGTAANRYVFNVKYIDGDAFDARRQLDVGEYEVSVSTKGGMARVMVARETLDVQVAGGNAALVPDLGAGIGITQDGNIEGAEVIVPMNRLSIAYRQPGTVITLPYFLTVSNLSGTTNDDTFFGFDAGSLLFAGADGRQPMNSDPTWQYDFLHKPNLSQIVIGDFPAVDVPGHAYVWVYFEEEYDEDAKRHFKKPLYLFVERMYDPGDFTALGIGS